ncbi:MAG: hypothetical protein P8Y70_17525 [Candidatus Lokiarchaeota archaeon]
MNKSSEEKKGSKDILEFYKNWDSNKAPLLPNVKALKMNLKKAKE